MQLKASAHLEQTEQPLVNLASLPYDIAIDRAHAAGRAVLADSTAVFAVFSDLRTNWMNSNVQNACGQSEDEFGELVNSIKGEFEAGVNEFIESKLADPLATRIEHFLSLGSSRAWRIYNVLAFTVEALAEDEADADADALPIHCTLMELRDDIEDLAQRLIDLEWRARHV